MNRINISMEFNSATDAEKAFDIFIQNLTDNHKIDHNIKFNNSTNSTETIVTMDEDDFKVFVSLTKEKE